MFGRIRNPRKLTLGFHQKHPSFVTFLNPLPFFPVELELSKGGSCLVPIKYKRHQVSVVQDGEYTKPAKR